MNWGLLFAVACLILSVTLPIPKRVSQVKRAKISPLQKRKSIIE